MLNSNLKPALYSIVMPVHYYVIPFWVFLPDIGPAHGLICSGLQFLKVLIKLHQIQSSVDVISNFQSAQTMGLVTFQLDSSVCLSVPRMIQNTA